MEITYKKTITNFYDLKDLCWSGAIQQLEKVEELGYEDELMEWIEENQGEGGFDSSTELNDLIWFGLDDDPIWRERLWGGEN